MQLLRRVLGPDVVSLAAVTLGPGAAFGEGVLATLTLQGVEPGVASLAFRDVVLSRPFGVAIEGLGLEGATLTVVPEPATSGLVAAGLVALAARRRRRP